MKLSLPEFIRRWKDSELTERAGLAFAFHRSVPNPQRAASGRRRPQGVDYAFEKHVNKTGDDKGFADVWKRGFFGWEYKGKHKDLKAAYQQLLKYREDLDNPPLLVVCDFLRFEVHTNFTNTRAAGLQVHAGRPDAARAHSRLGPLRARHSPRRIPGAG
jgi:hypothetical protein